MKLVAFARRLACVLPALLSPVAFNARASHPLLTEDTGVLAKGERELELHGERTRSTGTRGTELAGKLGYGLTESLSLELELPYARTVAAGVVTQGRGDAALAAKWRFLDRGRWSAVLKPEVLMPTGRHELGLGAGRTRWGINAAAGYELGRFALLAHLGYLQNRNRVGERGSIAHQSAAVLFEVTERLRLVADVARETGTDPQASAHVREAVFGATYAVTDRVDFGVGLRKVLNDAEDERGMRAGIKLRW